MKPQHHSATRKQPGPWTDKQRFRFVENAISVRAELLAYGMDVYENCMLDGCVVEKVLSYKRKCFIDGMIDDYGNVVPNWRAEPKEDSEASEEFQLEV